MKLRDLRLCAISVLLAASVSIVAIEPAGIVAAQAATLPADSAWMPLGQPIRGQRAGDLMGSAIAVSADAHTMVIGSPGEDTGGTDAGAVQVMEWNGSTWVRRGDVLRGQAGDRAGRHVSISDDGDTIALTAVVPPDAGGRVEVYHWINGAWAARGTPFTGTLGNPVGLAVLDGDGDTLVLGRPNDDTPLADGSPSTDRGSVEVFDWDGTTWSQRGATLRGTAMDLMGYAVAITPDAMTILVGSPLGDQGQANAGNAQIFDWHGSSWVQRGATLHGAGGFSFFGAAVDLSDDGLVVAVGAPLDSSIAVDAGRAETYRWDGAVWVSLGGPFNGTGGDFLGWAVALDASGDTMALSSPEFDAGGSTNAGRVRVLDWDGAAWVQRSWAPEGDAAGDLAASVALSADGTTMAIGRSGDDINGVDAGSIQVYASAVVRQLGTTVEGPVASARAGDATALDVDGDTWAVGIPHAGPGRVEISRLVGGIWTPLGDALTGEGADDRFGDSVALDAAGDTLVVGAPASDHGADTYVGRVRVYDWSGTAWVQRGGDLHGIGAGAFFGASVDIDASGDLIVVGAPGHTPIGNWAGQTTVWEWDGSAWRQLGSPILGSNALDNSGFAVSISLDGSTVAVGDPYFDAVSDDGRARVYRWSGAAWVQLGTDLVGRGGSDLFGFDVDIDATGDTLAVGVPGADVTANGDDGRVDVFTWNGAAWTPRGSGIDGAAPQDGAGTSVSISSDGTVLAVGSPSSNLGGQGAGHTRVFRFQGSAWRELGEHIDGLTQFEAAGSSLEISADGSTIAVGSPTRNASVSQAGVATAYRISRRSAPARPVAISSGALGPDRIRIAWTRGLAEVLDPVTHSEIETSTDGGVTWATARRASTDPSGTTITGLAPATSHLLRVRDINSTGTGPWHVSVPVRTTMLPDPRTGGVVATIAADDPYALAVELSQQAFSTTVDTVHVITGETFPDALAAGVVAGNARGPVLLTQRNHLPASTRAELRRLAPRRIVIVGGPEAVSQQVAEDLAGLASTVTRLGGSNRYATAASVALAMGLPGLDVVYVVNGTTHGDGTLVAPQAAAEGAPILLVTATDVPLATRQAVVNLRPRRVVVVGGHRAISEEVVAELKALGPAVERVAGEDLAGTAVALARRHRTASGGPVIVVNRRRPSEGLAIAPFTVLNRSVILMSEDGCIDASIREFIAGHPSGVVVISTDAPTRAVNAVGTACRR